MCCGAEQFLSDDAWRITLGMTYRRPSLPGQSEHILLTAIDAATRKLTRTILMFGINVANYSFVCPVTPPRAFPSHAPNEQRQLVSEHPSHMLVPLFLPQIDFPPRKDIENSLIPQPCPPECASQIETQFCRVSFPPSNFLRSLTVPDFLIAAESVSPSLIKVKYLVWCGSPTTDVVSAPSRSFCVTLSKIILNRAAQIRMFSLARVWIWQYLLKPAAFGGMVQILPTEHQWIAQ